MNQLEKEDPVIGILCPGCGHLNHAKWIKATEEEGKTLMTIPADEITEDTLLMECEKCGGDLVIGDTVKD